MIVVPVALAERPYDVLIGPDVRRELAAVIAGRLPEAAQAAVVTQAGIAAADWFGDLDPGLPFSVHEVADGEAAKSMATVETLCQRGLLVRSEVHGDQRAAALGVTPEGEALLSRVESEMIGRIDELSARTPDAAQLIDRAAFGRILAKPDLEHAAHNGEPRIRVERQLALP